MVYFTSQTISQSDYEALQKFKDQCNQILVSIKYASTLEDCNEINENISNIRSEYQVYRKIFDKALYPEDYESTFENLEKALDYKSYDLRQISTLTSRVGELETQVELLNQQNDRLIKQIEQLNLDIVKGKATIADLEIVVARLSGNIKQRDLLVRDLVDSLLIEFSKSSGRGSERERKSIVTKINKGNLFYNIKRTIQDNIQFTEVTQMKPADFIQMKNQHEDLSRVWKQIGPQLTNVYLNKKDKKLEIAQIDSLFGQWNDKIDDEIWRSILNLFLVKGIGLAPFNSADQFVNNISDYIDDKINNIDITGAEESFATYQIFADSIYSASIEDEWIPILLESGMLTQKDIDIIDAKIIEWNNKVTTSNTFWGFIVIAILIIVSVLVLIGRSIKPTSRPR
jgi:chaperonin cofactor prefoldin